MKNGIILVFLLGLMAVGFCASPTSTTTTTSTADTRAAIQITDYSTVPPVIYPNMPAQLKITLSNTGSETAQSVSVSYDYAGSTDTASSIWVGDIGPGANTIAAIPFLVPATVPTGVHLVYLRGYYTDSAGSHTNALTIPLEVSQNKILKVNTISIDKQSVFPNDDFSVTLEFKNDGGVINNLLVSPEPNSSFSLKGTNYQQVGNINSNGSKIVQLTIRTASTASEGKQMVPLMVSYQDALGNTISETVYAGPVSIASSNGQLRATLVPLTDTEIGSEAQFLLTLENKGTTSESAVVTIQDGTIFVPLGSTQIYFDGIEPGKNKSQVVYLGISSTAAAGYYSLQMNVDPGNGNSTTNVVGISVKATPDLAVTSDAQGQLMSPGTEGKVTIKIANTGNSAIRSVYVSTKPKEMQVTASESEFVGTLNVDDYFTYQPTIRIPANLAAGKYTIPVTITFKDGTNQARTVTKNIQVQVSGAGGSGSWPTGNATSTGFSPQNRRTVGFNILGLDVYQIAGILLFAVVAYFAGPKVYAKVKEATKK